MHHIAFDGWSMGDLPRRPRRRLRARSPAAGPSPLAPLAVQYADFAVWQRERLAGGALDRPARLLARAAGRPDPGSSCRPTGRGPRCATRAATRSPSTCPPTSPPPLPQLGSQHGATSFMVAAGRVPGAARPLHRPARTSPSAPRSPAAPARRPRSCSASSSTPWCCAPTSRPSRPSPTSWHRSARPCSTRSPTRTCRSSGSSTSCARTATCPRNPLFQVMFELQHLERLPSTLGGADLELIDVRHPGRQVRPDAVASSSTPTAGCGAGSSTRPGCSTAPRSSGSPATT